MKISKVSRRLGLVALATIISPFAVAVDAGWYVGGNVGESKARLDEDGIARDFLGSGFSTTVVKSDDRDIGYKLFGGYRFNRIFSLEGGYFDLGNFASTASTVPPGTLRSNVKVKGLNVDAVGFLPVTERLSAFARAGVIYEETKVAFLGTGAVVVPESNREKRDASYKFGLGLEFNATRSLAMRAEAERYRVDDAVGHDDDIDLFSLGLVYRFPGKTTAVAATETAPVREPEPVTVMPPAEPQKVTFSANVLFDFDKATVKPEGKQALDQFAADLKRANYDLITVKAVTAVTGHTDRIGTHDYNMRLSTRRAEAVKAYLVNVAGIPAGKIVVKGVDGENPVTKPGECVGDKVTAELIACLQPDRRVEVELSETP